MRHFLNTVDNINYIWVPTNRGSNIGIHHLVQTSYLIHQIFIMRNHILSESDKLIGSKWYQDSSSIKIRPQAKIDNFTFKNSNIIIEGLI